MSLQIEALVPFAAEAGGVHLSRPLAESDVCAIESAMDRHAVLVFRDQPLTQEQQLAYARRFGPLDTGLSKVLAAPRRIHHELQDISNVTADGTVAGRDHAKIVSNVANQLWHSDSSFQRPRAKYSMLSAAVIPAFGGETEFADLRMAYDHLPTWRQTQIADLVAVHSALHSRMLLGDTSYTDEQRKRIQPARWPLVQTDPRSGRKALYVGVHACEIEGMTLPEGRMLIADLLEHATQRAFVYQHHWRIGDLVMWDNTATVHRGRWYDLAERRELRRATTDETLLSHEANQETGAESTVG